MLVWSCFKWIKGEDLLTHYDSSNKVTKTFCKNCGSSLISIYKDNNQILGLPLGGVEGDLDKEVSQFHIFTNFKAKWYKITDDLKQYNNLPKNNSYVYQIKKGK